MPDLATLVQEALDALGEPGHKMTPRRAAREITKGRPSYETIRRIVEREHSGNLEDGTVEGLTKLGIRRADILRAIHRSDVAELPPWEPPDVAHRLTQSQRRVVESVIFALTGIRTETDHDSLKSHLPQISSRIVHTERIELPGDIRSVLAQLGQVADTNPQVRDELTAFGNDLLRRYGGEQTGG